MTLRNSVLAGLGCAILAGTAPAMAHAKAMVSAQAPTGPGSLGGVWTPADIDRNVFRDEKRTGMKTIEGQPPPLQPWVVDLMKKRAADARAGHPYAGLQSKCLPSGMPQMMFGSGLPKQTLETPDQLTILSEELTFFRIIRINAAHDADPDPTLMGDSVAHWEGPTLVVDTVAISDQTQLPGGIPHSDQLHLTERYTRTSKDRIEILMTFDDPKVFTRPWTTVTHLKLEPNKRLSEYYCENNRNVAVGDISTAVLKGGQ